MEVSDLLGQAYEAINGGKEFGHFLDVGDKQRSHDSFTYPVFSRLRCFYSETKFVLELSAVLYVIWVCLGMDSTFYRLLTFYHTAGMISLRRNV